MFEQIDSLDSLPSRRGQLPNRRAAVRYRCPPATPARVSASGAPRNLAWVHDLSAGGVGLLAEQPPDVGARLDLEIISHGGAWLRRPVRVAHATARPGGAWLVGCAFLQPVEDADIDAMFL